MEELEEGDNPAEQMEPQEEESYAHDGDQQDLDAYVVFFYQEIQEENGGPNASYGGWRDALNGEKRPSDSSGRVFSGS